MFRSLSPLVALPLALVASSALAADILPVQGNLTDVEGLPLDGSVPITFRLYANGGGGSVLWSEKRTVIVDNGAFAVDLGTNSTIDPQLFQVEPDIHLGMQIDGDSEMSLIRLGTAPYAGYAAYAGDAETLDGLSPDDLAELYEITPGDGLSFDNDTKELSIDTGALVDLLGDEGGFTAGEGIVLRDGEFSVDAGALADLLASDFALTAGTGIEISATNVVTVDQAAVEGWARGVALDNEAELVALLDDNYLPVTYEPDWSDLTSIPSGFADGTDDDTTYGVGAGLTLSTANVIGLDQSKVEDWAAAVAYDDVNELTDDLDEVYLSLTDGGTVEGDLTVDADLEVTGSAAITGDLAVTGDQTVEGGLTVTGDTVFEGDIEVQGDATFDNAIQIGDSSATCGTNTYGTIKWDGDELQACTKEGWIDLGTNAFIESDPLPDSEIVTKEQARMINGWVGNLNQEWTLCYRKSDHGNSSSTFHSRCDRKGDTISIVEASNGKVFGGYASCAWHGNSYNSYKEQCQGSFLFSVDEQSKFHMRTYYINTSSSFSYQYATYDHISYGPTFGGGHDLYLNSSMTSGNCNRGYSYVCEDSNSSSYGWSGYGDNQCRTEFCGTTGSFSVAEVEVWYSN